MVMCDFRDKVIRVAPMASSLLTLGSLLVEETGSHALRTLKQLPRQVHMARDCGLLLTALSVSEADPTASSKPSSDCSTSQKMDYFMGVPE